MKFKFRNTSGYTLVELMLVIIIISVLSSILVPHFDLTLQKANQSKSKGSLGFIRSTLNLYYADNEGMWPLYQYGPGNLFYTVDSTSLSQCVVPRYIKKLPIPKLLDRQAGFNGLGDSYDQIAESYFNMSPPQDVFIVHAPQGPTPFLKIPLAYDNKAGVIYYANDNSDTKGEPFYQW